MAAYEAARPLLYGQDTAAAEPWLFLTREGKPVGGNGAARWGRSMARDPELVAEAVRGSVVHELGIEGFG